MDVGCWAGLQEGKKVLEYKKMEKPPEKYSLEWYMLQKPPPKDNEMGDREMRLVHTLTHVYTYTHTHTHTYTRTHTHAHIHTHTHTHTHTYAPITSCRLSPQLACVKT